MPLRFAISSGNWSNAAIWSGSLIPTASDDAYANGFNVTIDQNINVLSISSGTSGSAVNGGSFISTNGISITASRASFGVSAGTVSSALLVTGSHTVYLSGSVRGGAANGIRGIQIVNNGNLYVTGSVTGGTVAILAYGIYNNAGRLEILGDIYGGTATTSHGVALANGTTIITGNLYGSTNAAPIVTIAGSGSLTVIGNTIISTTTIGQATGVYVNGGLGIVNILGNIQAHNVAGITILNASTVNMTGSLIAGYAAAGISSAVASTINVSGSIVASNGFPGISSTSTSATVRVTGPLISSGYGTNVVYSPKIQWISSSNSYYSFEADNITQTVTLYDPAYPITFPSASNVRSGSLYGATNQFSGSMIVPATSSVRYGVPVDNVTGSAALTPQDIFDYAVSALTASNTIGARLQNISTTQTTAAVIAAFKGK